MDPNQTQAQGGRKINPFISTFKDVIFTKPSPPSTAVPASTMTTTVPFGQPIKTPLTTSTSTFVAPSDLYVRGQGQTNYSPQGQGEGFYQAPTPSVSSTTTTTTTSVQPLPEVSSPTVIQEFALPSQTAASVPATTSTTKEEFTNLDYLLRSEKEEPVYPSVKQRARQFDQRLREQASRAKISDVHLPQTINVDESEYSNEIPMPAVEIPAAPKPPSVSVASKVTSTVVTPVKSTLQSTGQAISSTLESAKSTATHGITTAKDTAVHTLESAKSTVTHGYTTVKDTAAHTLETASHVIDSAKTTAAHTLESAKSSAVHGLHTVQETAAHTLESAKHKAAVGLTTAKESVGMGYEKAKEVTVPYVEKLKQETIPAATEYSKQGVEVAKEKAVVYGQVGLETAKDTAVYGAYKAVESLPLVKEYANEAASGALNLAYAALEIGKETAHLVKEVLEEGVNIAKNVATTTTTAAKKKKSARTRSPYKASTYSHVVSAATQPAVLVGEKVPVTYQEASQRLRTITEAALDKMNSMMSGGNIAKDELWWREAKLNLQQFAQFTVKSLWDFVNSVQLTDQDQSKLIENEALLCEKKIWARLADYELQPFRSATVTTATNNNNNNNSNINTQDQTHFTPSSSNVIERLPTTDNTVVVNETTIINSDEGTKRRDTQETYPVNHPDRVISHTEA